MMKLLKWARACLAPPRPVAQTPPVPAPQAPDVVPPVEVAPLQSMVFSAVSSERRAVVMAEADAEAVARWMATTVERHGYLYQEVAVQEVVELFGVRFTYLNAAGNRAINKDVLQAFNVLTGKSVAWEVGPRAWRKRADDVAAPPKAVGAPERDSEKREPALDRASSDKKPDGDPSRLTP
jgi:uncharacterized protein DUF6953